MGSSASKPVETTPVKINGSFTLIMQNQHSWLLNIIAIISDKNMANIDTVNYIADKYSLSEMETARATHIYFVSMDGEVISRYDDSTISMHEFEKRSDDKLNDITDLLKRYANCVVAHDDDGDYNDAFIDRNGLQQLTMPRSDSSASEIVELILHPSVISITEQVSKLIIKQ